MNHYVLGNWKSHGSAPAVRAFGAAFSGTEASGLRCGLALPFQLLHLHEYLDGLWLGAQDVSPFGEGAYTGEVTANMLRESGCGFCLVGHSERRQYFAESVEVTAQKLERLLNAGLFPVFCIGETLEQRQQGLLAEVLTRQLAPLGQVAKPAKLAVAYEPVWAIGTGLAASPADVVEAHALIRGLIAAHGFRSLPLLYGGSVNPGNAQTLAALDDVDGFLVGGASLRPDQFGEIVAGFRAGKARA